MSKSEQAGIKVAQWTHRHPRLGRAAFWSLIVGGLALFAYRAVDHIQRKPWTGWVVLAIVLGMSFWRVSGEVKKHRAGSE